MKKSKKRVSNPRDVAKAGPDPLGRKLAKIAKAQSARAFRPEVILMNQEDADALGIRYTREPPVFMSTDSATRKLMPVASGCLKYFPDALLLVSFISRVGNDKHNPGQPLHWAKEKSQDEPDAEVRHLLDHFRGDPADPDLEPLGDLGHLASKAWRALAHLQRACDAARLAYEFPRVVLP